MEEVRTIEGKEKRNFLLKIAYGDYGLLKTFWLWNVAVNILYFLLILFGM